MQARSARGSDSANAESKVTPAILHQTLTCEWAHSLRAVWPAEEVEHLEFVRKHFVDKDN